MKKALLVSAMVFATVIAQGQGTINFTNATSAFGSATPDRLLRWDAFATAANPLLTTGGLVSSNFAGVNLTGLRAQLFYGPTTVNSLWGLTALTDAPATFRSSTSANAGSWIGGTRVLPGFDVGSTVNLAVVVWDSSLSSDPLSAAAQVVLWGASSIFTYTVPTPGSPPLQYLPANLERFTVPSNIPEPSTFALAGLGGAALLIFRRRR